MPKNKTMETIFYLLGIIFAIFIAIYFLDTVHTVQESSFFKGRLGRPDSAENTPMAAKPKPNYKFPRPKICPLCHAELDPHDVLVATMFDEVNSSGKQRVLIHGCKYCNKRPTKESSAKVLEL